MSQAAMDIVGAQFADHIISTHSFRGDESVTLSRSAIRDLCLRLKEQRELRFTMLTDLSAVDYFQSRELRFEVVYHFMSIEHRHRLRVKVPLPAEDPHIDSIADIWKNANWLEREVWDMYGIIFRQHPDLRRILMYEEFEGHPLRKDYPKRKRQPLIRRPRKEIEHALGGRPGSERRSLI